MKKGLLITFFIGSFQIIQAEGHLNSSNSLSAGHGISFHAKNTALEDSDNFIYVKGKKDLAGFALQFASFNDLELAKEYVLNIVRKGDASKKQFFIFTVKMGDKKFYKVYYGVMKTEDYARQKQQTFLKLGYTPFVKEFK